MKMNKHYLPAIAAFFILAIAASSFLPVYATNVVRAQALPTLYVRTIPEDDEKRETGIMLLGDVPSKVIQSNKLGGQVFGDYRFAKTDFLAQFKVIVSYNGVPVSARLACEVIEKDKYNPLKAKQGTWENLATLPKDQSQNFVCKYREGKAGIGVIDVYWVGPSSTSPVSDVGQFIADYVLVVQFSYTVGRTVVYGTEMQDICVLGWPLSVDGATVVTKPDGSEHWVFPNALGNWVSCEDAALFQKDLLNIPIPWI
jgi:hypothetical protein